MSLKHGPFTTGRSPYRFSIGSGPGSAGSTRPKKSSRRSKATFEKSPPRPGCRRPSGCCERLTRCSGAGYDPQDVKVIFSPVTYVVFDGMSQRNLNKIELLVRPAQNRAAERVQNSIEQAINRGNVEFRTLRVDNAGSVS